MRDVFEASRCRQPGSAGEARSASKLGAPNPPVLALSNHHPFPKKPLPAFHAHISFPRPPSQNKTAQRQPAHPSRRSDVRPSPCFQILTRGPKLKSHLSICPVCERTRAPHRVCDREDCKTYFQHRWL
jgi:hypothetical protein